MILITTAGKVGSHAARILAEQGRPVRVLVRHPEKVAALADAGVEVFGGDLDSRPSIDAAMRGVDAVILVSLAIPAQELAVIASAQSAGAGHVVKITSAASADSPITRRRNQHAIEVGLIASGLPYTLLRNNAYMQNFLMMAPQISRTDSFSSATGAGRVGHIDARDVAEVAAAIATAPAPHDGQTYWPTGPQSLSGAEAAGILASVLGRPISFNPISFDVQRQAMLAAGLPEVVATDNATAVAMMADGDGDYVTDDVATITGRTPRSLADFFRDHAAAFAPTELVTR